MSVLASATPSLRRVLHILVGRSVQVARPGLQAWLPHRGQLVMWPCALGLVFAAPLLAQEPPVSWQPAQPQEDRSSDDQIYRWMMRATTDNAGQLPWVLMPISWGFAPDLPQGPERQLLERMRALQKALTDLQASPPTAALFREVNVALVAELGVAPRARDIRHRAYDLLRERGIFVLASERADKSGAVRLTVSPPGFPPDDMADANEQGVLTSYDRPTPREACTWVFWFCPSGGTIDDSPSRPWKGGALKVEGFGNLKLERCKTNLNRRLSEDPAFRRRYEAVLSPLLEEARRLDPASPEAITAFLRRVYERVEGAGISAAMAADDRPHKKERRAP
jgi:hypothetical protein